MDRLAREVDAKIRSHPEVKDAFLTVGSSDRGPNVADFYIVLVPRKERTYNTSEFKAFLRKELAEFKDANPVVKDVDMVAGGLRPFTLNIIGHDLNELEKITTTVFEKIKDNPALLDVEMS